MGKEIVAIRKTVPMYENMIVPKPVFIENIMSVNTIGDYDYELYTATGTGNVHIQMQVKANTNYTLMVDLNCEVSVFNFDASAAIMSYRASKINTFNTGSNTNIRIYFSRISGDTFPKTYFIKNLMLVEGSYTSLDFYPYGYSDPIKERLKDAGIIEELRVRYYPGVERTLKVRPYILHKSEKSEDFFTYPEGTEPYITGDDDYLIFPVSVTFDYDDELVVWYENTGQYPYSLTVDIVVNYGREVI